MKRPVEGIATDGVHSTKNRQTSYRGVDLRTGEQLFLEHIGNQTINIGEFLGVVEAVKYIIENDYHPKVVYTGLGQLYPNISQMQPQAATT